MTDMKQSSQLSLDTDTSSSSTFFLQSRSPSNSAPDNTTCKDKSDMITITCKDKSKHPVDKHLLTKASATIESAFEAQFAPEKNDLELTLAYIPNASVLQTLVTYLEHYRTDLMNGTFHSTTAKSVKLKATWEETWKHDSWEANFVKSLYQSHLDVFCHLTIASVYLSIDRLKYVLCAYLAMNVKGKSFNDLQAQFQRMHEAVSSTLLSSSDDNTSSLPPTKTTVVSSPSPSTTSTTMSS